MANITQQYPIRYQIDNLSGKSEGLIYSNNNYSINLTNAQKVTGISITGSQPALTKRYLAFKIDNKWGKLNSSGNFAAFSNNNIDSDTLAEFGNSPDDLTSLTDIPALAGKNIGIAVLLSTTDINNAVPSLGISFKCETSTQRLTDIQYSPIYQLGENSQIIDLQASTTAYNGGSVSVAAQVTYKDNTKSEWLSLDSFIGQKAKAVQFRGTYSAKEVDVSSAEILNAYVIYSDGNLYITGTTNGEIVTLTQDWYMPIHSCRLTINHNALTDSQIKAYVTFRDQPKKVRSEILGFGSGGRKTFQLDHTGGIRYDTFKLYYDNERIFADYELNCEVGRLTCTAPEGVIISCDYDYGYDFEHWEEMTLSSQIDMEEYIRSEYRYSTNDNIKSLAAIKIVMSMQTGHINNEVLGTGNGTARSYKLSKSVYDGNINITANNTSLSVKNWRLLEDSKYVSVAATAGQTIRASYDWQSETPIIYQYAAVFSE